METLLIPLRIFFQGRDDNPKYFDGKLNPFLFFLPLVAMLAIKAESKEHRQDLLILFAFAVLYLLSVYIQTDMRIRWAAPMLPALTILSVYGVRRLILFFMDRPHFSNKWMIAILLCVVVVLPLGMNMSYIYKQFKRVAPWEYLSGKLSRSSYITRYRPEYAVITYANDTLNADAKILAFYLGNRIYYSNRQMDCNYTSFFKKLTATTSEEELLDFLNKQGVTHILIRFDMFQHHIDTRLGSTEKNVLKRFFQNCLYEMYVQNGHGLFALSNRAIKK